MRCLLNMNLGHINFLHNGWRLICCYYQRENSLSSEQIMEILPTMLILYVGYI